MSSDRERLLEYRRRVQARYAPVVTVVTTPAVDASCAASGLTFADLLRPFCELRGLDVPMRHNPEAPPYTLTEFAIRVHSLAECRQPAADVADDHMTRSVAPWASSDEASLARTLAEIPRDVPSLVALARDGRAPGDAVGDAHPGPRDEPAWFCTPWLNRYAARLDRTLMFAEHESVDHPAGMIVAVSADHPDPVAEFRRLTAPYYQNPDSYPPLMRSEAANPDVPKHFVLVHDGRSTTTAEDVAATFDDAKTNLGDDAVSLLPVNSGPGAHPVPDVWSAHAEIRVVTGDGSEAGGSEVGGSEAGGSEAGGSERSSDVAEKGALMSDSDVVAHRRFVERFAVASLIPAMEARLRALNANISATRKGLKNQFKSFWGRSTGQIAKPEGDGGYTFRSAESEIRVAADLAFALRDHDTAAQHYRLLQSDYKADKAWRRLGAAQEALGHALALSKPEATWIAEGAPFRECRRDAERELEQAAQCFARAHVNGNGAVSGAVSGADAASAETSPVGGPGSVAERTRLATRASLAHAAFLAACGAHREAAAPLMRVSAEEGQTHLRGGLLLEAAATEYCRASPPMVRKCAIHLVLAGHRYNQGGSGRTLFGVTPRRYPCISTTARRRRRLDRREERREAPRREVRVQTPRRSPRRDGVARRNIFTSRSGDRLRTRVRSSPRKSIFGDCWSARGANPRRRNPPTSASISTSRGAPPTPPPPTKKTKLRLDRTDLHRTGSNRRRTRTSVCLFPSSTRATFACTSRMDTATPSRRPRAARRPRARRGPRRVGRAWRRTDWFPPGYRGAARRGWINPGRRVRSSAACAPPARRLAWTFDSETRSRFRLT